MEMECEAERKKKIKENNKYNTAKKKWLKKGRENKKERLEKMENKET
jgi:hypothetical protein